MKQVSFLIDEETLLIMDTGVHLGYYGSRAELMRIAIKKSVERYGRFDRNGDYKTFLKQSN